MSQATLALTVRDLTVGYGSEPILEDVSFNLEEGASLGLIGPSGVGKTTLLLALLDLLPHGGRVHGGEIVLGGVNILTLPTRDRRRRISRELGWVTQEPRDALDPIQRVGAQLMEILRYHGGVRRSVARGRSIQALKSMGVSVPEELMEAYPHELSSGLSQRVILAMALLLGNPILLADEPTSALDVVVKGEITALFRRLCEEGLALLVVSHDLPWLVQLVDEVAFLWRGRIVERGPTEEVLARPQHPYTETVLGHWSA